MNTYRKYCPNVYVAQCDAKHEKGEVITLTTKYGDEHDCVVYNYLGFKTIEEKPAYYYSITRADGFNCQERAKDKAERLQGYANNAISKSDKLMEQSQEGADFLALGEPIKVGHHSEGRHRALIARNWNRIGKACAEQDKAEDYERRSDYWERMAKVVNLSMPESLDVFQEQLEEAISYHQAIKDGKIPRDHAYTLTYANKKVKDLTKKVLTAKKLWGEL